jgi:DNA polymerase III delta prime subunit
MVFQKQLFFQITERQKMLHLKALGDIEYRLNLGASEKIQLAVLTAAFAKAKSDTAASSE